MTTLSEIRDAEKDSPRLRFALRHLLHVKFSRAKPDDTAAIEAIGAVKTPAEYDALLASPAIADLFRRQVLYFGDVR